MIGRDRRGIALVEALVAVVVLATTALGYVALESQTLDTLRRTARLEREVRLATDELARLQALPYDELASLAGRRRFDSHWLLVTRERPTVFIIEIRDGDDGRTLLASRLYRRASDADARD